ncbi:MAG TPA: DNA primase [Desulfobacteraceae bacterium]|nr:DNA primase [Desulfobacteraceae bacterium]HPJ66853.1 DNA primase [Desulfobacteraceae bacterium]HPQ28451.1 DNA primase [Desulfobacteraceae bacterium]
MVSFQSAKEEIKRAADIVEIIGQVVQLKKAGKNYLGLCPFHSEKDPSFTVNQERQTFHCFGCKKGGDVFSFWMEYHGSTFPEALRDLAERYNIQISQDFSGLELDKKAIRRKELFNINEKAAEYFQDGLKNSVKGSPGMDYLKKRALSSDVIAEFRLGFAPDKWDGLTGFLRRKQIDLDMAVQSGVIIPSDRGGYYDRFRGRIIFPILDQGQKIVGFGGRVLDNSLPKYLNTPETPLFRKGEFLYGLNSSFQAIREKNRAVIVEGYMDCLALINHGLKEVVATLGTALTNKHVRKLKGYANEAVVVFDSDKAGKKAALRSLPVFSNEGLSAKVVILPDGHDPDTFVNANGLTKFLELLDQASPILDYYLDQKLTQENLDIETKARILKEIIPTISDLNTHTQRALYVRRVSERLGIGEEVMLSEMKAFKNNPSKKLIGSGLMHRERLKVSKREKNISDIQLLNLLVHHPHTIPSIIDIECKTLISDPVIMEIVDTIFERYKQEGINSCENLEESLKSEFARIQFREALSEPSFYSENEVDQAIEEFEVKASQKKFLASFKKVKGDAEAYNELLKLKRLKNNHLLNK